MKRRILSFLALATLAAALVTAGAASASTRASSQCARGTAGVVVIAKKTVCLKIGSRCARAHEAVYRHVGLTCRAGRIARYTPKRATPPPPPAPALGTRANPFPFGVPVSLTNGWTVAATGYQPDATASVLAKNIFNRPPAAGHQFAIANIHAVYTGTGSSQLGFALRFQAVGASSVAYGAPFAGDDCGVIPGVDESIDFRSVFTGGAVDGSVCWSIASADADSLLLWLTAGANSNPGVFMALR
jgi:hypothetical protein